MMARRASIALTCVKLSQAVERTVGRVKRTSSAALHGIAVCRHAVLALAVACLAACLAACTSVRLDTPRPASYAIGPVQDSFLGRAYAARFPASGETSGVRLVVSGVEAFVGRAALAEAAQRTLDLQLLATM
jgi:hypothetical protein